MLIERCDLPVLLREMYGRTALPETLLIEFSQVEALNAATHNDRFVGFETTAAAMRSRDLVRAFCLSAISVIGLWSAVASAQRHDAVVLIVSAKSSVVKLSSVEVRKLFTGLSVSRDGHVLRALRNDSDPLLDQIFLRNVVLDVRIRPTSSVSGSSGSCRWARRRRRCTTPVICASHWPATRASSASPGVGGRCDPISASSGSHGKTEAQLYRRRHRDRDRSACDLAAGLVFQPEVRSCGPSPREPVHRSRAHVHVDAPISSSRRGPTPPISTRRSADRRC